MLYLKNKKKIHLYSPGFTLHQTDHLVRRPRSSSLASTHLLLALHHKLPIRNFAVIAPPLFPSRGTAVPEIDRLQFPPPTGPHAETGHQARAGRLEQPPEPVARHRARIERGDDEVQKVQGEGEVGHQLGARDEDEEEDRSVLFFFLAP